MAEKKLEMMRLMGVARIVEDVNGEPQFVKEAFSLGRSFHCMDDLALVQR